MFQYRQVLVRLRQGESDRDIARSKVMGRHKVAKLRALATERGWLAVQGELPDDAAIATALGQARRASSTISSAEPHRGQIQRWFEQGSAVWQSTPLCAARMATTGSYSAVRRMLQQMRASLPPDLTVPLYFAPGMGVDTHVLGMGVDTHVLGSVRARTPMDVDTRPTRRTFHSHFCLKCAKSRL